MTRIGLEDRVRITLAALGRLFSALMVLTDSLDSRNDAISALGHCQNSNILVGVVALDIIILS